MHTPVRIWRVERAPNVGNVYAIEFGFADDIAEVARGTRIAESSWSLSVVTLKGWCGVVRLYATFQPL